MATVLDMLRWARQRWLARRYDELVSELVPDAVHGELHATLQMIVCQRTGLQPSEFLALSIPERVPWLEAASQKSTPPARGEQITGYLDLYIDHSRNTITREGHHKKVDDWGKHEWPLVVAMINAGERGLTEHEAKQAFTGDKDGNAMNTAKSQIKSKLDPLALTIRRGQFKIEDDGTT